MRATAFFIMSLLTAASAQQTYQLVWQDEFDGNSLDLSKWQYEVNCDGGGNNELQCYTNSPNNVAVRNGSLVITAIPQNYNGKQYTSGRINTARSASWKYGRIDFSAKTPGGIYLWPALWMMPRDSVYGSWAASGEIDIMENRGGQNTQESTLHYGGSWPNNVYQGSGPQTQSFDMTRDFHLYSAIWTPESIQFLIDNKVYHTQSLQRGFWSGRGNNPYTSNGQPFDQNFFIIINLAIGGGFFGANANSLTTDMARNWNGNSLYVDYVRVYQLRDSAVTPNPTPSPSNGACTNMFNGLQCRTSSQSPSQVDSNGVTSSRNWLCSAYPQFCTAINSGGQYSGCNSVEQLSYAMNLYYAQFGGSQGAGACNFGGIGRVIAPTVAPTASSTGSTPATSSPATACTNMYNSLQCRTASQDPSQLDTSAVNSARNWLCNNYGQFCTAVTGSGQYSTCNSAEQLSHAMNQYYNAFSSQGASACNFGGVGRIVTPGATQQTPCQSMYSKLKCRTKSQDPAYLDSNSISNTRSWLCNGWPQYCSAISAGGTYSLCNAAEQVSYAMDMYYSQYGTSQGAGACVFGGLGAVSS